MDYSPSHFYINRSYESSYHYSDHIQPIVILNMTKSFKAEYLVSESDDDCCVVVSRTRADQNSIAEPSHSVVLPPLSSGFDVVSDFICRYLSGFLLCYPPCVYDIVVPEVLWKIPNDAGSWWHDKGFCLTVDVEVVQVFDRSKVMWSPQQGGYQYQWRGYGGQYDNQDHGHGGALITNSTMMVPERGQPQPQYRDEGFFRETTEFYREWRSMLWDRLNSCIDDRRVSSTSIDYILKTLVFTAARPIPIPSQQGNSAGSCAICLEELFADDDGGGGTQEEVLGLRPCSHMFHASCIRKWLERKTSCPMCREELGDQLLDPPKSDPPGWALAGY